MAFAIGKSSTISKWFEYAKVDDKAVSFKIRSAEYEPFQALHNQAGVEFNAQDKEDLSTLKPYDYFLMKAFSLLIEDWQNIDLDRYDDQGELIGTEFNVPCTDKNKLDVLYAGDLGFVVWNFVKTNAEAIAKEVRTKRNDALGKSLNSTDGPTKKDSSPTIKKRSAKKSAKKS